MHQYRTIIDQALEHIRHQQSPDGSFASLSGFSTNDFSNAIPRQTTFFAANILTCLQDVPGQTADIQRRTAQFLLAEKNERWSFNYWTRSGREKSDPPCPPYPDDFDDTFAALTALVRHDAAIIDGHVLAAIAKLLTAREGGIGGPYRTWLVEGDAAAKWQDVDLVVNSTIGFFLSLIGVHLPRVKDLLDDAVRERRLSSPYYPGIFHVGYFLSRWYEHHVSANIDTRDDTDARDILADIIAANLTQSNIEQITTLEHAMAISSLIALGRAEQITPSTVDRLAARVAHEGFLPYAFCIDPTREGKPCYAGASALTAAFCAKALSAYSTCDHFRFQESGRLSHEPASADHIHALARSSCRTLDPDLREMALARIGKITDETIATLAYEFREILCHRGEIIPLEIVEQLALANFYGWMAYEIYDDTLDGENAKEEASALPCANLFLRALTEIYDALDAHIAGAKSLFNNTMDHIDNANAWEQKHCRIAIDLALPCLLPQFGDHQTLSDRSIGHAMGPLAQLLYLGYTPRSEEYIDTELFFQHYLIARQLHDDAHDWADDLMRNRVNSIGELVLRRFQEKYPDDERGQTTALAKAMPLLKKIFWKEIIGDAVRMIDEHIAAARGARERSLVLTDTDFMENALRKLENGAQRAIAERNNALDFLNDYNGSPASSERVIP
jgi:hypothetical protein